MRLNLLLTFLIIPFLGNAQILQNIGIGTGFYQVEPTLIIDVDGNESFVGEAMDIQYLNLLYEPRIILADSILKEFSISAGLPLAIGFSQYTNRNSDVFGYGSAQVAAIGYLNWGNCSQRNNVYNRKLGLSLGFGATYLHSGIIKEETDIRRPKNDLIRPVVSYSLRYKTERDVIWALNLIWRLKKEHSYEECSFLNPTDLFPYCRDITSTEDGFLIQLRVFFGQ